MSDRPVSTSRVKTIVVKIHNVDYYEITKVQLSFVKINTGSLNVGLLKKAKPIKPMIFTLELTPGFSGPMTGKLFLK